MDSFPMDSTMSEQDRLRQILVDHRHLNDVMGACYDRMIRLENRVKDLEIHNQSLEERFRDYLETALVREDMANARAETAEKRRLPHWAAIR